MVLYLLNSPVWPSEMSRVKPESTKLQAGNFRLKNTCLTDYRWLVIYRQSTGNAPVGALDKDLIGRHLCCSDYSKRCERALFCGHIVIIHLPVSDLFAVVSCRNQAHMNMRVSWREIMQFNTGIVLFVAWLVGCLFTSNGRSNISDVCRRVRAIWGSRFSRLQRWGWCSQKQLRSSVL